MSLTIAEQIIAALKSRAETIFIANGYRTDAGAHVFRGRQSLDVDDLPCVILWPGEMTEIERHVGSTRARWELAIVIEAVITADPNAPGTLADALCADLMLGLVGELDETLGGLTTALHIDGLRTDPRDDGGVTEGASLTLRAEYFCGHGNPYAAA